MSYIFISYSHKDKDYVHDLQQALQNQGLNVWIDDRIDFGTTWPKVIQQHLDDCTAFIVVMTEIAYESEWVQNEVTRARRKKKPFFALLLSGDTWLSFEAIQYEDVTGNKLPSKKFYETLKLIIAREDETAREKEEREVAEKAARERAERDAAEKAAREKEEKENAEKLLRMKAARENAERIAHEKAERDAAKKLAREKQEQEKAEKIAREKATREAKQKKPVTQKQPARKSLPAWLGVLGIIFIVIVTVIIATNQRPSTPIPTTTDTFTALPMATETFSATASPLPTEIVTPEPPTITPAPTLGIGSTMISDTDGMVMVYVPAGSFKMGSDDANYPDEQPMHSITLDAFWIDQTDVTNAMYTKCVSAAACQPPTNTHSATRTRYYGNSQFDDYSVVYVDWDRADAYCKWARRRLPTEAEWEKAARGADQRIYPWGNEAPNNTLLNYNKILGDTTEVGKYTISASPYGALDMAGNVWQWVADWYDANDYYYETLGQNTINPQGPPNAQNRVIRGGAWFNVADEFVRSAYRGTLNPLSSSNGIGFRCASSNTQGDTSLPASPTPSSPSSQPTPTEISTILQTQTSTAGSSSASCKNDFTFIGDVNMGSGLGGQSYNPVQPGTTFTKTWQIKNTGTCTWNTDYVLVSPGSTDNTYISGHPHSLSGVVAPGQSVNVSVDFVAPTGEGLYWSAWKMTDDKGNQFGNILYLYIAVIKFG
jgi:formylglycine-generating enzyme required for sulfatase activity